MSDQEEGHKPGQHITTKQKVIGGALLMVVLLGVVAARHKAAATTTAATGTQPDSFTHAVYTPPFSWWPTPTTPETPTPVLPGQAPTPIVPGPVTSPTPTPAPINKGTPASVIPTPTVASVSASAPAPGYGVGFGGVDYNHTTPAEQAKMAADAARLTSDAAFAQSELTRTDIVIANLTKLGVNDQAQIDYRVKVQAALAGHAKTPAAAAQAVDVSSLGSGKAGATTPQGYTPTPTPAYVPVVITPAQSQVILTYVAAHYNESGTAVAYGGGRPTQQPAPTPTPTPTPTPAAPTPAPTTSVFDISAENAAKLAETYRANLAKGKGVRYGG